MQDSIPKLLAFAGLFIVLTSIAEGVVLSLRAPGSYNWRIMGVSILDLLVRNVLRFVLPVTLALPLVNWLWQHRLFTIALDNASAFLLLFVGQEFCYYWYHRAGHRVRWFWLSHSIHHSPNELNLAAAYRLGWTGTYSGVLLFFMPLVWLGFPVQVVLLCLIVNLLYQFWIHATWIPKLGWLEYVLNTPSAHRVHHAANLEYLDGNYGGVLIIFDRLFGTYIPERHDITIRYGWVQPIHTLNVFKLQFTPWMGLFADLRRAKSLHEVWGLFAKPPGWRANGPGQTTEELRLAALSVSEIQVKSA
jgi:sterol desaturase/sphingolipid hydroxylase (fatty acid hydroxylase superfamily)